jgi:hypothetical protein
MFTYSFKPMNHYRMTYQPPREPWWPIAWKQALDITLPTAMLTTAAMGLLLDLWWPAVILLAGLFALDLGYLIGMVIAGVIYLICHCPC